MVKNKHILVDYKKSYVKKTTVQDLDQVQDLLNQLSSSKKFNIKEYLYRPDDLEVLVDRAKELGLIY